MSTTELIDGAVGKIAVHDLGGSGTDTLLVCHATGFLGMAYRALADELADDAKVVAVDVRAHGDSDTPPDHADFDWRGMADDITQAIAHINPQRLHGFGHSMGGAALLEVERSSPHTFASAMVFEPIVPPAIFQATDTPIQRAALGRTRTFPSYDYALIRYAARPPLGLFRADVLSDYVHHGFREDADGQVTLKCLPESEAATLGMAGTISLASLAEIELDVVVARSLDGSLPSGLAIDVHAAIPNSTLVEFPTITHFGPLQDPVVIANAIREMIGRAPGA